MTESDELAFLDATEQADLVRRKEVTPLELVDRAIARIEALNPRLNAVISTRFEKARSEAAATSLADGPFRGVPFLLKDLDAYSAGDPYHCGMRASYAATSCTPIGRPAAFQLGVKTFCCASLRSSSMLCPGHNAAQRSVADP
jgi:amidase